MTTNQIELEPIKASQERLVRIFSDEFAFSIPAYQRPYAWDHEHAKALLDDVLEAIEYGDTASGPSTYFLGSIVLIKQSGKPDAEVVDGQQRLTTLTILFAVLRDMSEEKVAWKRHSYICEEGDSDKGTIDRFRLALRKRDASYFETTIQNMGATHELTIRDDLGDSQKRIVENALFFLSELKKLGKKKRATLISFLLQHCYLVVIAVTNIEMAQKVFTVLNARGLDLTPTDILKATLLDKVSRDPDISNESETVYAEQWEDLEVALGRERFVDLFQHIRMIYQREKPRERLETGFRRHVPGFDNPKLFMSEILENYGDAYLHLQSPSEAESLYGQDAAQYLSFLDRLDNADWVPPALYFLVESVGHKDKITLFLQRLERLAYYLFVMRANINDRITRFSAVTKDLENGIALDDAEAKINLNEDEKVAFIEQLNGPIYEITRARMTILLRLDAALSSGGATYTHNIITVEHVLPQNPEPDSDWLKLFPEENIRHYWLHRLGNLVLLTRAKNSQAKNWDFVTKKERYFSGPGGITPFAITSQVLREDQWDISTVERRQLELIGKLSDVWELRQPQ